MAILIREFFDFILERQNIWYKRFILKEKPPWTHDKVLQKYKIINMYRELDRCTLYLLKKLKGVRGRKKLLLNIIFFRFFNKDKLYENLGVEPFSSLPKEELLRAFEEIKKMGNPIFNNAYLISSGTHGQQKHISVLESLSGLNVGDLIKKIDSSKTPRESLNILQEIPMVGPFLACEIWTDLTYFDFFKQGWNDNDFVNIGPGASWGLEIIFKKRLSKNEQEEKLSMLHNIQLKCLDTPEWREIAYKGAFSNYPFLSITNIEGSLCEFRKYWRIKSGKGRRKYFNPSSQS